MTGSHPKLVTFRDKAGEWRWSLKARNGKIVADSGEGYSSRANAIRAAERVSGLIAEALNRGV